MKYRAFVQAVVLAGVLAASSLSAAQPQQASAAASPQEAAQEAPTVSELHRLQVQNYALRIELAQLRAQQAQVDYGKARQELEALVQSLQRDGYELDLQTLTYVKKETPAAPAKGAKK